MRYLAEIFFVRFSDAWVSVVKIKRTFASVVLIWNDPNMEKNSAVILSFGCAKKT